MNTYPETYSDKKRSPWGKPFKIAVGLIAFTALAILLFGEAKAQDDLAKMQTEMFAPTVQLNGNCSGVIYHSERDKESGDVETLVLTAKHCVDDKERGDLAFISTYEYNDQNRETGEIRHVANIHGLYHAADLATVKLRNTKSIFPTAAIANRDVDLTFGQDVFSVGYPLGFSLTFTKGTLGYVDEPAFKDFSTSGQFYRATPAISPGSSGGPLFTKVNGEYQVIGIATGGYISLTNHLNFFTPIEEIHDYLGKVDKTLKTSRKENDDEKERSPASR